MTPHQTRVIAEKGELDQRIGRLSAFIDANPTFASLPANERGLLRDQLAVMRHYSTILAQRIASFPPNSADFGA